MDHPLPRLVTLTCLVARMMLRVKANHLLFTVSFQALYIRYMFFLTRQIITHLLLIVTVFLLCTGVSGDSDSKIVLIKKPDPPKLPKVLRQNPAKGIVLMKVRLNLKGEVEHIEIIRSSTIDSLDDFLAVWVRNWVFIVDQPKDSSDAVYTVITIRYDLAEQRFETPMTATSAMIVSEKATQSESVSTTVSTQEGLSVFPIEPLRITSIPPEIQNSNLKGGAVILCEIQPDGAVSSAIPERTDEMTEVHRWIIGYLKTTRWRFSGAVHAARLRIPVEYDTSLCKVSFGSITEMK